MNQEIEQKIPMPRFTWMKFLNIIKMISGLFVASLGLAGIYLIKKKKKHKPELIKDWREAQNYSSAENFIEKNKEWLRNVELGGNVCLADLDWKFRPDRESQYGVKMPTPEELAARLDALGIHSVRFDIRMEDVLERTQESNGKYPFRINLNSTKKKYSYELYLNALAKSNATRDLSTSGKPKRKVLLNIGVKTMRYPEEHPGTELLEYLYGNKIPGKFHKFGLGEPLTTFTLNYYYPQLYRTLKKLASDNNYPDNFFYGFQPENEANNPFGKKKWTFNREYSLEAIRITHDAFPNAKIVQGNPPLRFKDTNETLLEASARDGSLEVVSSLHYYYRQPEPEILGIKILGLNIDGEQFLDNFIVADLAAPITGDPQKQKEILRENGTEIIVGEMQSEPWGSHTEPGNNFKEFVFAILRVKRFLELSPDSNKTQLFVWGIEELLYNLGRENPDFEHLQIAKIIKGVNSLN